MTTLVLMRHGNTFDPGETPRRVGRRTDLSLSDSGQDQAEKLGRHLKSKGLLPGLVFVSPLARAEETAQLALAAAQHECPLTVSPALNEIDYGPDENCYEDQVVARLGEAALKAWDEKSEMPAEWSPRPEEIKDQLVTFLAKARETDKPVVWAVTSNGVARFVAEVCRWQMLKPSSLKLATGAYALLQSHPEEHAWDTLVWNIRP